MVMVVLIVREIDDVHATSLFAFGDGGKAQARGTFLIAPLQFKIESGFYFQLPSTQAIPRLLLMIQLQFKLLFIDQAASLWGKWITGMWLAEMSNRFSCLLTSPGSYVEWQLRHTFCWSPDDDEVSWRAGCGMMVISSLILNPDVELLVEPDAGFLSLSFSLSLSKTFRATTECDV